MPISLCNFFIDNFFTIISIEACVDLVNTIVLKIIPHRPVGPVVRAGWPVWHWEIDRVIPVFSKTSIPAVDVNQPVQCFTITYPSLKPYSYFPKPNLVILSLATVNCCRHHHLDVWHHLSTGASSYRAIVTSPKFLPP